MSRSEIQETLQRYLGYLEQDSKNVHLILNVSDYFLKLGDFNSAQRYLDEAKQRSGKPYWAKQGLLYLETKQIHLAKKVFIEALSEERSLQNTMHLAISCYLNHDFDEALSLFNEVGEHDLPNDVALMKIRALLFLQRTDEAIAQLKTRHDKHPSDADVAGLLSLLYFDTNDIDGATSLCKLALEIKPSQYEGQLVRLLLKTLKQESPTDEIEMFLSFYPEESRLWYVLGMGYFKKMHIPKAWDAFRKATEICPHFYEGWIYLGWCHLYQDTLDEAEKAFRQALMISDDDGDGWGGFALVCALRNDRAQAKECSEKALLLDNGCLLASMAQMILANKTNPTFAGKRFSELFPQGGAGVVLASQNRRQMN